MRIYLNDGWSFYKNAEGGACETVRLPHTNALLPFNYADGSDYELVSAYERELFAPEEWRGRAVLITFDGVAHRSELFVNGAQVCDHACGYTAFTADISAFLRFGQSNRIRVVADARESLDIPPFGGRIDYLTYGGMYREARLDVREKRRISDIFVRGRHDGALEASISLEGEPGQDERVRIMLIKDGVTVHEGFAGADGEYAAQIPGALPWSPEHPELYTLRAELISGGTVHESEEARFGFRTVSLCRDGLMLNGERCHVRGLNRHQSYPYIGYAAPERLQRRDAHILKNELGVNAVRTAHYPQSQHFINACDELGLLVFTELPGWQHIGESMEWRAQAKQDVSEMVMQYRNHPSIIMWGVRINEGPDCHELYEQTNAIAHASDPTRPTGGVRNIRHSELLEDAYTYNDFIHAGDNAALLPRKAVTAAKKAAYFVTEYGGHMFPSKPFDDAAHRTSHALRHAAVLSAMSNNGSGGGFGWCMADYNTHPDFGSGDGVCWHGVLDMWRSMKEAGFVYAAEGAEKPYLEIGGSLDMGDYPRFMLGDIYAYTNADFVRVYCDGELAGEFFPVERRFSGMAHPPIRIGDMLSRRIAAKEGLSAAGAKRLVRVLGEIRKHGHEKLSLRATANAVAAVLTERKSPAELKAIVTKYVCGYGEGAPVFRFDAVKDGKIVSSLTRGMTAPGSIRLRAEADTAALTDGRSYDMASIRIWAEDAHGATAHYCFEPLKLRTAGAVELVGPETISLMGGMGGAFVRTRGEGGKGALTVESERLGSLTLEFEVSKQVVEAE